MDPYDTDDDQQTLNLELFVAINYGRKRRQVTEEKIIKKVSECLCDGADIDAINHNDNGNTVLHIAIKHHYKKVIRFLLENGARMDIKNSQGLTALTLAQGAHCEQEVIDLLEIYTKSITSQLSITYSKTQSIWNKLSNNPEIAVLEVNSVELSPDFLQQVEFYDSIDNAGNLFFVDVIVNDMDNIDEEFIVSRLNRLNKQLIIQCGSVTNTNAYCKVCESDVKTINLNSPVEYFDEKILTEKISQKGFDIGLIIEAIKLNLVGTFQTERRSLIEVRFELEKQFDGCKLIDFVIRNGDAITARLLSLNPWNLSQLDSSETSTLTLAAQHGDVEKLAAVLKVKFPVELNNNICLPKETAAHFDKCKKQMLETAVRAGNYDIISFMMRCGVQLDEDIIQLAWDNKLYDVVLFMLRADCVFPYAFDLDEVDVKDANFIELRSFVKERDNLHSLIMRGQSNSIKEFVKFIAPSKLYLDRENRSAVYKALKFNHFSVFVWLKSELKAEFKNDMERRSLGVGVLDSATDALVPHFVPIDNAHILHLVAKSRSRQNYASFKDHIESIYMELNAIPQISTVLKVIQFCDQVDIIYDFEKDSIVDDNLAISGNVTGFCEYKVGRIYIGAKVSKQELLGTVAHELTHLAIQTIYDNDCKPYKLGVPMKEEFDELINKIREKSTPFDPIIRRVFSCYGESDWASELIVRVNHMLAYYGSTDGLSRLEVQAKSLLEFYTKNVENRFDNFVSESHLIKPRYLIKVLNDSGGLISKFDDYKIDLKNCVDVGEVFGESEVQIAVVTSTSPFLSTMGVYQSLNEISQQPNSFMIFNFEGYLKRRIEINQAFYSDVCDFLVLLCESVPEKSILSQSLKGLAQVLWKKLNKKVIFIMENFQLSNDEVNELVNLSLKVCPDVEYTLDDVGVESAKLLLDQSVSLQCRDANIKLSSLIDEEHYKLVDAQTLLKLINKQPIVIGKEIITSTHYDENFYIFRSFNHRVLIKEDILSDVDEFTMYAISEIDEETLGNFKRRDLVCTFSSSDKSCVSKYVIVDSSNGTEQYQQLCKQFPQHNIHWLKKVKGGFQWLESRCIKGDLTQLQKFVWNQSINQNPEDKLANQDKKQHVFIVSDTAGTGKSTVLTSLALRLTKQDLPLWVITVNLNDYTKVLEQEHEKQSIETSEQSKALYYFVDRLLGSRVESRLETEFERNLLLHLLQHNEDRVVIMFDGFDEIKEGHQQIIKDVLFALKSSKVKQLWVTTRPHMRETLENTLHHLSYTLQPFSEADQRNFLTRFWRQKLKLGVESDVESDCSFDKKLQCFAEMLIKLLSKSISDKEKEFTGVPLQLRMIAECFEEKVEMFCKSGNQQFLLPFKLKLKDLYQNFFIRKHKILQSEKNKSDYTKPNVEAQDVILRNSFLDNHQIASLFALFDERELELFLTTEQIYQGVSFISDISNYTLNTGIIDLVIEGKPRFVHLTFAEYFTAEFIVRLLAKELPSIDLIELILTKVLYVDKYKVVRAFIDNPLDESRINDAVLNKIGSELRYSDGQKSLLHVAAVEGNANIANVLLHCLVNSSIRAELIKCVDESNRQALHFAAQFGHLDVVKVLVQHGADTNLPIAQPFNVCNGFNALLLAASYGRTDVCEWLINNGANISATVTNKGQFNGYSLLHCIAQYGGLNAVENIFKTAKEIDTSLHDEAEQGCDELLEFLLTVKNFDVNAATGNGYTPLHLAADSGKLKAVDILLSNGASVNDVNCIGEAPSLLAIRRGSELVVDRLLKTGHVDVNLAEKDGYTPLHLAANYNNVKVFIKLLNYGADVNAVNCYGETPLHGAASNGSESVVNYLLNIKDVDVNAADENKETPLHLAASKNKLKIVKILVTNGANVNAVNIIDHTPLHDAAESGSESVVNYLLNIMDININGVGNQTPLHLAALRDKLKIAEFLVTKGGNVNAVDRCGRTPLHYAAKSGSQSVVNYLLNITDVDVVDKENLIPLHLAALEDELKVVEILVTNGSNVNAVSRYGETPLHFAAKHGSESVVKYLLNIKGVDISAVDVEGRTPLDLASMRGNQSIVEIFAKEMAKRFFMNAHWIKPTTSANTGNDC